MSRVFEDQEFHSIIDRESAAIYDDYEFRRCRFVGCGLSITREVRRRSTIRRARLIACEAVSCSVDCAIVEDSMIDGLKTSGLGGGLFQTWGAVFKHVILRGKIGRVMMSAVLAPDTKGFAPADQQRALDEANRRYYETVDWALDIREAEFVEADLRGIPGQLVRRDPDTQVLVRRENALRGSWRQLDLAGTHWGVSLELLAKDSRYDAKVLVASRRARNFSALLTGLKVLRDSGVADPN